MTDTYVCFGNAQTQIQNYKNLVTGMCVLAKGVKTLQNHQNIISYVICRGKNVDLLCIEQKNIPFIPAIMHPRYFAYITRNGKKKLIYGTIAELLYNQYAKGEKPVAAILEKVAQGKTK